MSASEQPSPQHVGGRSFMTRIGIQLEPEPKPGRCAQCGAADDDDEWFLRTILTLLAAPTETPE